MTTFTQQSFDNGTVIFRIFGRPPSIQSRSELKNYFKEKVRDMTSQSDFIITGTCHIAIDYRCNHITRRKNPGIYDMDNIVKPIIDTLVGLDGLIVDDVLINRVTVNWQDTQDEEHSEIEIEYPILLFEKKNRLIFIKSPSGWCYPTSRPIIEDEQHLELLRQHFSTWDAIRSEDNYYESVYSLPLQSFIFHSKLQGRGYEIIDLLDL